MVGVGIPANVVLGWFVANILKKDGGIKIKLGKAWNGEIVKKDKIEKKK